MEGLEWLARVLEYSVERNGEKPLTNAYLLNIIRMTQRAEARNAEAVQRRLDEVLAEDKKWGS